MTPDDPRPDPPLLLEAGARTAIVVSDEAPSLIMGEKGPIACVENAQRLMCANGWSGKLVLDLMQCRPILLGQPPSASSGPYPRWWTDADDVHACTWMQRNGMVGMRPSTVQSAVLGVSDMNQTHPVREYLDGLEWDGRRRLDAWLIDCMGVMDTPLHRAFGSRFLISAVARVRRPGCKADHMLILEGEQGVFKSTALAALMPDSDWYSDDLGDDLGKAAAERLQGRWIVEVAELDALSRADATRIKAFVSRTSDNFRPAYGRYARLFPRQCVFAGSTNENQYLKDSTGGRRFWPVKCGTIDPHRIRRDRDQLWAEADQRFKDGAPWWLDEKELVEDAREAQADRYDADVWQDLIAEHLSSPVVTLQREVTVSSVLLAIGVKPEHQDRSYQMRVAHTLQALKWYRVKAQVGTGDAARRTWVYKPNVGYAGRATGEVGTDET